MTTATLPNPNEVREAIAGESPDFAVSYLLTTLDSYAREYQRAIAPSLTVSQYVKANRAEMETAIERMLSQKSRHYAEMLEDRKGERGNWFPAFHGELLGDVTDLQAWLCCAAGELSQEIVGRFDETYSDSAWDAIWEDVRDLALDHATAAGVKIQGE